MVNPNITDTFIGKLIEKNKSIPESVIWQARNCLLDYLGVLIGGKKYLNEKHPNLIETLKKSTSNLVFLHGFAAHVLELDDGHRMGMIHLSASIVTAVLEVAKKNNLSTTNVLHGIAMGYEVAVRCARAIQPSHKMRGYHVSGTCGTIGSAMGIAFACGYNENQLKSTLACAVSSAAGLLEIQEQASELKPFNVGRAAIDGYLAAQIGRLGLLSPDDILGGKRGFLAALTDTPHPEYFTDFSNENYSIEGIYQKVHAACRHSHPAIDAISDLCLNIKFTPEQVDKIDVHTYKLALDSHDHTEIRGISSAKLSTPFGVALAIVKGSAGYADYNEETINDYWINIITRKVHVIEDENLTQRSPEVRGARVTLYLKDGSIYESSCLYPKGEPENPLSQKELEEKFRGLATYGGLTKEECDDVINEVWKEDLDLKKIMNIICK